MAAAELAYSLGIVLYELVTGTLPFNGDTPVEIAMKHLSQTPELPSSLRPELPHELDLVVTRALAKDPDERYQSAEEMDADLERLSRGAAGLAGDGGVGDADHARADRADVGDRSDDDRAAAARGVRAAAAGSAARLLRPRGADPPRVRSGRGSPRCSS